MKMEKREYSETSAYKLRRREITQKKTYNIQNKAKVWDQEAEYNCAASGYSRLTQGDNPLLHNDYELKKILVIV
jgi:hypothetical protein